MRFINTAERGDVRPSSRIPAPIIYMKPPTDRDAAALAMAHCGVRPGKRLNERTHDRNVMGLACCAPGDIAFLNNDTVAAGRFLEKLSCKRGGSRQVEQRPSHRRMRFAQCRN